MSYSTAMFVFGAPVEGVSEVDDARDAVIAQLGARVEYHGDARRADGVGIVIVTGRALKAEAPGNTLTEVRVDGCWPEPALWAQRVRDAAHAAGLKLAAHPSWLLLVYRT
jgi:hypothetical protein